MPEPGPPAAALSAAEIDARMRVDGFPELRWLWESFKSGGTPLEALDPAAISRRRDSHMGALLAAPRTAAALSAAAALGLWALLTRYFGLGAAASALDLTMAAVIAVLAIYAAWFAAASVQRTMVHPWKRIAAEDLAFMLARRDYRAWLEAGAEARAAMARLRGLGVTERWDDPGYRIWLSAVDGRFAVVERLAPIDSVRRALREVLGAKQDKVFQPGRYLDCLKDRKQSVTRFVAAHQAELAALREGALGVEQGAALLAELRRAELQPESAGARYLDGVLAALAEPGGVPAGVVEAAVWARDPWSDLGAAGDFFSSASLRADSWKDALERRTKGMLGPFGYLRNKSVSALDFRTKDGRGVRARLAAAVARDAGGREYPVLFVDAVEGRFDVKPGMVRLAVEHYARAAGFARVLYHAFPLNQVPLRFVAHLAGSGARLEALDIEYADAARREYLDAFGLPVEPFENAYPRGRVIGYGADLTGEGRPAGPEPGALRLGLRRARSKGLLWAMMTASFACLAWSLARYDARLLAPAAAAFALAAAYESVISPLILRKVGPADAAPPDFIARIVAAIAADPVAVKMSYPARLQPKLAALEAHLGRPIEGLRHFYEAVLYNASLKDTHLENSLKFLRELDPAARAKAAGLLALLWPRREDAMLAAGLGEDKEARTEALKETAARLDALRRFVKNAPASAWDAGLVRDAANALHLSPAQAMEVVALRPRILRGRWKPPRPIHAWPVPVAAAAALAWVLMSRSAPAALVYAGALGTAVLGTCFISLRLAVAPGVLRYEKTRRRMKEALAGAWVPSGAWERMRALGIVTEEYARAWTYEDKEAGVRIEARDRRTLKGAVQFLTSSEEIGNCIALRNFVSWTLPSLLDDESVMLADVALKGAHGWQPRAQVWMAAAERGGVPVLTVNSVEFNEEGAKRLDAVMPAAVAALKDVCRRAGFKALYVGISDFGRGWFDARFPQGACAEPILKVHHPGLGTRYYFDSFVLRRGAWEFMKRRTLAARAYAVTFGALEFLKGNRAKAGAFFDSARNAANFWEIPLQP